MATAVIDFVDVAAQWRVARRIYPIYLALGHVADPHMGACRDLESPINRSEPAVLKRVDDWFARLDEKIAVHQLRQTLQTSHIANEENLRDLLLHQLSKLVKSAEVRDKVDYLCVQYYAHRAQHDSNQQGGHSFAQAAELLRPILGDHWQSVEPPPIAAQLEDLIREIADCRSFGDVVQRRIIERGREIKSSVGGDYCSASSLVAFARFNYMLRHSFFRLVQADLQSIRMGLHELENRAVKTIDASGAGLSAKEPLSTLRQICDGWKKPFRAPYAPAQNFEQILQIGKAVNVALTLLPVRAEPEPAPLASLSAAGPALIAQESEVAPGPSPAKVPSLSTNGNGDLSGNRQLAATGLALTPAAAPESVSAPSNLEACLEQLADQLISGTTSKNASSMPVVMPDGTKMMLASWEVAAFVRGGDEISDFLQRGVAARTLLLAALDRKKLEPLLDLAAVINVAHAEVAMLQEKIAEAKDGSNIDGAVNLAATAKRLLGSIDKAEQI